VTTTQCSRKKHSISIWKVNILHQQTTGNRTGRRTVCNVVKNSHHDRRLGWLFWQQCAPYSLNDWKTWLPLCTVQSRSYAAQYTQTILTTTEHHWSSDTAAKLTMNKTDYNNPAVCLAISCSKTRTARFTDNALLTYSSIGICTSTLLTVKHKHSCRQIKIKPERTIIQHVMVNVWVNISILHQINVSKPGNDPLTN